MQSYSLDQGTLIPPGWLLIPPDRQIESPMHILTSFSLSQILQYPTLCNVEPSNECLYIH